MQGLGFKLDHHKNKNKKNPCDTLWDSDKKSD